MEQQHCKPPLIDSVAPNSVTHKEFTKTLANVLHKPLWLPNIPKSILNLILGEMHVLLLLSQRVSSKKIEDLGFNFKHYHLQTALEDLV